MRPFPADGNPIPASQPPGRRLVSSTTRAPGRACPPRRRRAPRPGRAAPDHLLHASVMVMPTGCVIRRDGLDSQVANSCGSPPESVRIAGSAACGAARPAPAGSPRYAPRRSSHPAFPARSKMAAVPRPPRRRGRRTQRALWNPRTAALRRRPGSPRPARSSSPGARWSLPGSCTTRGARHRARAPDRPRPSPVTRAASASSSVPAWDTSPDPSADTVILVWHAVLCTG